MGSRKGANGEGEYWVNSHNEIQLILDTREIECCKRKALSEWTVWKNLALEESFKIWGKTPSTTYRKNLSKFERQGERKNRDNSQLQEKQKVE